MRIAVRVPVGSYTSSEVLRLAGITYRQLDYWAGLGLIRWDSYDDGSVREAGPGSGRRRCWSTAEVRVAYAVRATDVQPSSLLARRLADHVRQWGLHGSIVTGVRGCWRLNLEALPDPLELEL